MESTPIEIIVLTTTIENIWQPIKGDWVVAVANFGCLFHLGENKPDLVPGDRVKITITKVD